MANYQRAIDVHSAVGPERGRVLQFVSQKALWRRAARREGLNAGRSW